MTYDWVLTWFAVADGLSVFVNQRSMNDAMTNILMGKLNALKLRGNFFHRKLNDCAEAGEGASNQLQGSSKFDAPPLF